MTTISTRVELFVAFTLKTENGLDLDPDAIRTALESVKQEITDALRWAETQRHYAGLDLTISDIEIIEPSRDPRGNT